MATEDTKSTDQKTDSKKSKRKTRAQLRQDAEIYVKNPDKRDEFTKEREEREKEAKDAQKNQQPQQPAVSPVVGAPVVKPS